MTKIDTDNRIHRVLWTGGFDSTYRMIELALQDVIVEPVYVVNPIRRSRNIELSAMKTMLEMLRDSRRFRAEIRDIKVINREDIRISDEIHEAYDRLHESYGIGPQYEWLAPLSKDIDNLEICIEKAPEGRLHSRDAIIDGSKDSETIFGDFVLPIFDITEEEMVKNVKSWGCEDITSHIWFCNHPLESGMHGSGGLHAGYEPCGLCHPCRIKVESGMNKLLPTAALSRYHSMRLIEQEQGNEAARDYRMKIWSESGLE